MNRRACCVALQADVIQDRELARSQLACTTWKIERVEKHVKPEKSAEK
jgi:hypothetical protein